ncbi:HEAT repeat-containing protein 6 [Lamellibrachia satsuma]|nr:HEAT repeat-containing protein 6 [Lamellibrachia satsuma]
MVCRNTEQFNQECSWILDELNALDFSGKIIKEEDASALLRQCCYLVQLKHEHLVTKVCLLTVNLLSVQKMVLLNGAEPMTEYLVEALQCCSAQVTPHILHALGAVLYENSGRLLKFHDLLLGHSGLLTQIITCVTDVKVLRGAVQCLDSFTIRTLNFAYMRDELQGECLQLLLRVLRTSWPDTMDDVTHSKILINAIRGIQNMVLATKMVDNQHLGSILAALKVYMVHGLPGAPDCHANCPPASPRL